MGAAGRSGSPVNDADGQDPYASASASLPAEHRWPGHAQHIRTRAPPDILRRLSPATEATRSAFISNRTGGNPGLRRSRGMLDRLHLVRRVDRRRSGRYPATNNRPAHSCRRCRGNHHGKVSKGASSRTQGQPQLPAHSPTNLMVSNHAATIRQTRPVLGVCRHRPAAPQAALGALLHQTSRSWSCE